MNSKAGTTLGAGGHEDCDVEPPKVMSDVVESVIGALLLDREFALSEVWEIFMAHLVGF